MLTPVFRCRQDGNFIIVDIDLPALHCKVSSAEFDILQYQFTFSCHPYYLRLVFQPGKLPDSDQTTGDPSHTSVAEEGAARRLQGGICEGKGERAVYDISTNTLTVYLPKAVQGEIFPNLDIPGLLIATTRQRRAMEANASGKKVQVLSSMPTEGSVGVSEDDEDDQDESCLETEFVQELSNAKRGNSNIKKTNANKVYYGFNNEFTGVFSPMETSDAEQGSSLVAEVVDIRHPELKSPAQRRQERIKHETEEFDDGAFWFGLEDPDGEVAHLMEITNGDSVKPFVPWYKEILKKALADSNVPFIHPSSETQLDKLKSTTSTNVKSVAYDVPQLAVEDDDVEWPGGGDIHTLAANGQIKGESKKIVVLWEGNSGDVIFHPPASTEQNESSSEEKEAEAQTHTSQPSDLSKITVPCAETSAGVSEPSVGCSPSVLATPHIMPIIAFTPTESAMLQGIEPRLVAAGTMSLLTMPIAANKYNAGHGKAEPSIWCLLVDLLAAYVYDYITTLGEGNVESMWTVTKLSPSLSFLDCPRSVYEAAVGFARRALTYPLLRHWTLVDKVLADVGAILLCGPYGVIRGLLALKHILDNTEHHHILAKLFINPFLGFITGCMGSEMVWITEQLRRTAMRLHAVVAFVPTSACEEEASILPHIAVRLCDGFVEDEERGGTNKGLGDNSVVGQEMGNGTSRRDNLIRGMIQSKTDSGPSTGSPVAIGPARQLEPLGPFTIGLPVSIDEVGDAEED